MGRLGIFGVRMPEMFGAGTLGIFGVRMPEMLGVGMLEMLGIVSRFDAEDGMLTRTVGALLDSDETWTGTEDTLPDNDGSLVGTVGTLLASDETWTGTEGTLPDNDGSSVGTEGILLGSDGTFTGTLGSFVGNDTFFGTDRLICPPPKSPPAQAGSSKLAANATAIASREIWQDDFIVGTWHLPLVGGLLAVGLGWGFVF